MQYEEILHRCFRCGFCKLPSDYSDINCPAYLRYRFESFSPGGRMWLIRAWLDGNIQADARFQEVLFSCATCNNCVEHCIFPKFKDQLLNAFIAAKAALVDEGRLPPQVRDYLTRLLEHGNPYKMPRKKRGNWASELGIESYAGQEYLFYVGDVGSFDESGARIARSVANVFRKLGLSFGILGEKEGSDGNEARALGETELFKHLAERNIDVFKQLGVEKVVTLSPHGYNALKNDYPELGGEFQVFHYTQLLVERLPAIELPDSPDFAFPRKATFHDPCYLGRHNQDYESARQVLDLLPGIERVEMKRSGADALCCGGGGGNFFTDLVSSGAETAAKVRVREAADTLGADMLGADKGAGFLVTACPVCTLMLEDAVKSQNLDGRIQVREISELVAEQLF